ncbi:MAG: Altered inheritance of mitochondria protein 18 mitochondrial [Peltula sp. TS41687]|nr:MAG: Altered inheritance of mitochondria protein 18 mitochondrial [Peltula sp. TS41687]
MSSTLRPAIRRVILRNNGSSSRSSSTLHHHTRRHASASSITTTTTINNDSRASAASPSSSPGSKPPRNPNPLDPISFHRLEAQRRRYYLRRMYYAAGGMLVCMGLTVAVVTTLDVEQMGLTEKNDAGPTAGPFENLGRAHAVVLQGAQGPGDDQDEVEQVPTGSDAVPTFPRVISVEDDDDDDEADSASPASPSVVVVPPSASSNATKRKTEYQLLGLGVRTVSFLSIKVYVVGVYVATDDVAALQAALVRAVNPRATTLIPAERETLRTLLLEDPERGEEVWADVLRDQRVRTVVRIVPTRNTDFQHLKDGWLRGIMSRAAEAVRRGQREFGDAGGAGAGGQGGFEEAVGQFKRVLGQGRKKVPAGRTILLVRGRKGEMRVLVDRQEEEGKGKGKGQGWERLGRLEDERISRLVWLNYLAGRNVASESARRSVVDGVMGFVERPIGTVNVVT